MPTYEPQRFDSRGFWFVTKISVFVLCLGLLAHSGPVAYQNIVERRSVAENRAATIERLAAARASGNVASAYTARTTQKPDSFTIGFVGDIMLDRGIRSVVERHGEGDYHYPFAKIADTLSTFDILFGNLEGAMSATGKDKQGLYSFRMDPKGALVLRTLGFDVLSTANNHSYDWGPEALADTPSVLARAGITPVGTGATASDAYAPVFTDYGSTRVGFVAYTDVHGMYELPTSDDQPTLALLSKEHLAEGIKNAREYADIVVVSIHFGDEYVATPNARQREYAEYAIDAGADLVIGHHPHTVQPVERYKNGYIAYSLGNFIFDQNFSLETATGLLLGVRVVDKRIVALEKIPVHFTNTFQPYIKH